MKAKLVLLFSFVAVCFVLAIANSLPARQLGPPTGQRVPPPSPAPKPATPHPAPDLEGRCNQLLFSAFMKDSGSANPFRAAADLELISNMVLARKCIALPNIDIRLAAFDARRGVSGDQGYSRRTGRSLSTRSALRITSA